MRWFRVRVPADPHPFGGIDGNPVSYLCRGVLAQHSIRPHDLRGHRGFAVTGAVRPLLPAIPFVQFIEVPWYLGHGCQVKQEPGGVRVAYRSTGGQGFEGPKATGQGEGRGQEGGKGLGSMGSPFEVVEVEVVATANRGAWEQVGRPMFTGRQEC